MTNKNIPQLRFKEFEDEWEINLQLGETIKKQFKGKAKLDQLNAGTVMYLDANALNGDIPFMSNAEHDTEANDVLIMWDGSNAGKVFTGFEGALGSTLKGYKIKDENNSSFIFYHLLKHQQKIYEQYRTPNIPHVIKNFTEAFKISSPALPEQSAIGSLFQTLDELLSAYKDNLANYQAFKATMLSKMFPKAGQATPEVRLDGSDEMWEEKKLSEIAIFNPKAQLPKVFKYVDLESVVGTNLISYRIEKIEVAPSRAQRLAQKGDIFFQTVRPYQKNNYLFSTNETDWVFSTGYAQLRPKIDNRFLFNSMQRDEFVNTVLLNCTGTSYPAINSKDLSKLKVYVPNIDEQRAIGAFFANLDDLIASQQAKITELETLKKKLLQDMFF
ncbi:restriction endonuclease subunit S [Streptococcus moroccensis]|uniref:Type I restriction enzyme S subunit n=1 Tax=Streptococcus moroccensis TaxID=1451356 RepID=A0ABT9YQM1_9STRE|nr:restriction endonuclease subunit S [Streptococcus moroccensis]MDQ0222299.1 type I restriction enzyme S subunit [Streptococcus moroccensis]